MDQRIRDLVAKMTSTNSEAIFQLALVLERSTLIISNDSPYILNLSPQLQAIILTPADQKEIIDAISQRIALGASNRSQLFWVMGKAPGVAMMPLITLLEAYSQTFDEETAWQSLIALENCLELANDGNLDTDTSGLTNLNNLRPIIQKMESLNISNPLDPRSNRLAEIVERILRRIEA